MGKIQQVENWQSFGGEQGVYRHHSSMLDCEMNFAVYLPPQAALGQKCPILYWLSGLTCTERNFIEKSGFQRYAAEFGIVVVVPDTSPRGDSVIDGDSYDLGHGAGFYLNATEIPWAAHYQMYDYVADELPQLIQENFSDECNDKKSICGHSMGGHGALVIGLRNPEKYRSISAFAPIVAPSQVPWGKKAFRSYLGENQELWRKYDSTVILKNMNVEEAKNLPPIRIEQGLCDQFLTEHLQPERIEIIAKEKKAPLELHRREGYDHSYYFIATFIGEHFLFHSKLF